MWILRNLTEDHGGKGRGKNSYKQRGKKANHKRLLSTENKLRVDGGWGRGESSVMGNEEDTRWYECWVLYGSQFDNKLYFKKKKTFCMISVF